MDLNKSYLNDASFKVETSIMFLEESWICN